MSFHGILQQLLVIFKVAATFRALAETKFARVMSGDTSQIEVIDANAASSGPGSTMARTMLKYDSSNRQILPGEPSALIKFNVSYDFS